MRYLMAVACPPVAWFLCGRPIQGVLAVLILIGAVLFAPLGVTVTVAVGVSLAAVAAVADEHARVESSGFVATVSGTPPRPSGRRWR